jgi:hypothetical protein
MPGETLKPINDIHKCITSDMQKFCDIIKNDVEKSLSMSFNKFKLKEHSSKISKGGKISYCLTLNVDNNECLCVKAFQKEEGGEWNIKVKEFPFKKEGKSTKLGKEGEPGQFEQQKNLEKPEELRSGELGKGKEVEGFDPLSKQGGLQQGELGTFEQQENLERSEELRSGEIGKRKEGERFDPLSKQGGLQTGEPEKFERQENVENPEEQRPEELRPGEMGKGRELGGFERLDKLGQLKTGEMKEEELGSRKGFKSEREENLSKKAI